MSCNDQTHKICPVSFARSVFYLNEIDHLPLGSSNWPGMTDPARDDAIPAWATGGPPAGWPIAGWDRAGIAVVRIRHAKVAISIFAPNAPLIA